MKTPAQKEGLEAAYTANPLASAPERRVLAEQLGLTPAQVDQWFNGRRQKDKKAEAAAAAAAAGAAGLCASRHKDNSWFASNNALL